MGLGFKAASGRSRYADLYANGQRGRDLHEIQTHHNPTHSQFLRAPVRPTAVDQTAERKSYADRVKWDRSWDNAVLLFTRQSPGRERTANIAQDGVNG
jgi:hypothetical protein